MSARIAGTGWVTPLGMNIEEVWRKIDGGEQAAMSELVNPESGRVHMAAPIPRAVHEELRDLAREPRLRRASAISLYAAAAGRAALADAWAGNISAVKGGMAVVFGVSNGGVQYTRRFYEQVVKQGANAASPLLFPETVYNAPASHLAAMLGVDGATYTLVGDGTVGMQALHFGTQLLAMHEADQVLVVAAEELDWILAEAHSDWHLLATGRPVLHRRPGPTGALISEGAAAVLLTRDDGVMAVEVSSGASFSTRRDAARAMSEVLASFDARGNLDFFVDGANGTWVDDVIAESVRAPAERMLRPKDWFGEAIGCGALMQVIVAAHAIDRMKRRTALAASLGWNQQAMAAWVERCA